MLWFALALAAAPAVPVFPAVFAPAAGTVLPANGSVMVGGDVALIADDVFVVARDDNGAVLTDHRVLGCCVVVVTPRAPLKSTLASACRIPAPPDRCRG
jgi:hypothetical protein